MLNATFLTRSCRGRGIEVLVYPWSGLGLEWFYLIVFQAIFASVATTSQRFR